MRYNTKKIITALFLLFSVCALSYARDTISVERIEELEKEITILSDSLNSFRSNYSKDVELSGKVVTLFNEFVSNPVWFLLEKGLIITAISLFFFFLSFGLIRFILKRTNPKWYEKWIQRLIDKYEGVNVLKREKKILIVSINRTPENKDFLQKFFDRMDFENIKYCGIEEADKELSENTYDIIFANNEYLELSQQSLVDLISKHKNCLLFYFGKSGSWQFKGYDKPEYLTRINLANSRAQIYGNLISSLQYQKTF